MNNFIFLTGHLLDIGIDQHVKLIILFGITCAKALAFSYSTVAFKISCLLKS